MDMRQEYKAPPKPGDPDYRSWIFRAVQNQLVWRMGRPVRARGKVLDELVKLERAEAWNEALDHVAKLSDPANTIVQTRSRRELITLEDIEQAREENPYGK